MKLLNLGLALLPPHETEQLDSVVINRDDESMTQTGRAMGTKAYMAPEQMNDTHNAGARADVYGLGATTIFLLTRAPTSEAADFPPGIDVSVWKRLLAVHPAERFEFVGEVARHFTPTRNIGSSKSATRWVLVASGCVIAAIGIVLFLQKRNLNGDRTAPPSSPAIRTAPSPATWPFDTDRAKDLQQACADYYQMPIQFDDRLGIKYVLIPPGEYSYRPSTQHRSLSPTTWPLQKSLSDISSFLR